MGIAILIQIIFFVWGLIDLRKQNIAPGVKIMVFFLLLIFGVVGFLIYWLLIRNKSNDGGCFT